MAEKTVVRQLLEWCEYRREKSATIHNASWNMIIAEIKDKYIEIEKQQIIDTYLKSQIILANTIQNDYNIVIDDDSIKEAEQYYEETYKK